MCVENLDFIVDVQHLRSFKQELLKPENSEKRTSSLANIKVDEYTNLDDNISNDSTNLENNPSHSSKRSSIIGKKRSMILNIAKGVVNKKDITQMTADELAASYFYKDDKGIVYCLQIVIYIYPFFCDYLHTNVNFV